MKKLVLKKDIVARINNGEMNQLRGGYVPYSILENTCAPTCRYSCEVTCGFTCDTCEFTCGIIPTNAVQTCNIGCKDSIRCGY